MTANIRHIALWGYGREGRALHNALRKQHPGAEFTLLNDDATDTPEGIARIVTGPDIATFIASAPCDMLVKSPGVSLYRPEIQTAKQRGIAVTSSTRLWFEQNRNAPKVIITASKGKSTTCSMLHHMLVSAGLDCVLAGNIGVPLLDCTPGRDMTVLEMSSYQLADLHIPPDDFIILNLYPSHLLWHGGEDAYYRDKTQIADLPPAPLVITNARNAACRARFEGRANTIWFNDETGYRQHEGRLFKGAHEIPLNITLRGDHVRDNLAALCAWLDHRGHNVDGALASLATFKPLPHRIQEIGTTPGGVVCVNDSISTVPQSAAEALKAYRDKNIVLILGGHEQGQDYAQLCATLCASQTIRAVMLLPDTGGRIAPLLTNAAFPVMPCANMNDAVNQGLSHAKPGDVLLLSPAAPSFNQFRNFEERGARFAELCGLSLDRAGDKAG